VPNSAMETDEVGWFASLTSPPRGSSPVVEPPRKADPAYNMNALPRDHGSLKDGKPAPPFLFGACRHGSPHEAGE
jgi:hypothetical protein